MMTAGLTGAHCRGVPDGPTFSKSAVVFMEESVGPCKPSFTITEEPYPCACTFTRYTPPPTHSSQDHSPVATSSLRWITWDTKKSHASENLRSGVIRGLTIIDTKSGSAQSLGDVFIGRCQSPKAMSSHLLVSSIFTLQRGKIPCTKE